MKHNGFGQILIILVGVGFIFLAGVFFWANFKNGNSNLGLNLSNVPACPKMTTGFLTSPLVEEDKLERIIPLGNINSGGGHVLLTDHMYFLLKGKAKVFAPADITISTINESKTYDLDGTLIYQGYDINFAPCRKINFSAGEVSSLSPTLLKLLDSKKDCNSGEKEKGYKNNSCIYQLNIKVKSGEHLGWAGENNPVLDVGAYDSRVTNPFINPKRYNQYHLQSICPIDLYSAVEKELLYGKLADHSGKKRKIEPLCGTNHEDVLGTISGGWFIGEVEPLNEFSEKILSIVHDNFDTTKVVIVTSGTIIPKAGQLTFIAKHEGLINREPKEVKDSTIYCFQNEFPEEGTGIRLTGRILTQLVNEKTLKIEYQQGKCIGDFNFISPIIYKR